MAKKRDIAKDRAEFAKRVARGGGMLSAGALARHCLPHYIDRTEAAEAALERAIDEFMERGLCPEKDRCLSDDNTERCEDHWREYLCIGVIKPCSTEQS